MLSDHFYYFGINAKCLPTQLKELIKRGQGHKKIERPDLIHEFEKWISQFERNKLYGDPQMGWLYDRNVSNDKVSACIREKLENDEDEFEETVS